MTYPVFPALPGLGYSVKRTPVWRTRIQESVSGKETRVSDFSFPRYLYELSYDFMRQGVFDGPSYAEQASLLGFFNAVGGAGGTFLFNDPDDNAVAAQSFGTGDGATVSFQLLRALGGFLEPVQSLNGAPAIFESDWNGNQLQYSTPRSNLLDQSQTLGTSPWSGANVTVASWGGGNAPDGTATAQTLTPSVTLANRQQAVTVASDSSLYMFSIWVNTASASTHGQFQLKFSGGTNFQGNVSFDPATGAVTGSSNIVASGSIAYASGWFQIWGVIQNNNTGNTTLAVVVFPDNSGSTTNAAIYWGAQLTNISTQSLPQTAPTSYIATTTAPVTVTDYALGPTGIVTFAVAPLAGAAMSWTGSYYWAARFNDDQAEFEKFLNALWSLQSLKLISVKF